MERDVEIVQPIKQRNLECTEQEKVFCDLILAGATRFDAVIKAGYYPDIDHSDPKMQNRIKVKASNLLKKKCVEFYLQQNKKKIYITDDCDVRGLKHRMYLIGMGQATTKVLVVGKDGPEYYDAPPSFKDQISAAGVFLKMNETDRKYKLAGVESVTDRQLMVQESKVKDLLAKYQTADILTTRVLDERGIEDADYEEVE